jgi:transketolase
MGFSPADRFELTACMLLAYQANAPVYMRIGKSDRGDVHDAELNLTVSNLLQTKQGQISDMAFIATGSLVRTAMDIASFTYPNAAVWSMPFIKPIDCNQVLTICIKSKLIVVLEEHSIMGGIGSVIAEIASEFAPVRILRVGVQDRFSHHCGTYEYLLKEHGLDRLAIEKRIQTFIAEK